LAWLDAPAMSTLERILFFLGFTVAWWAACFLTSWVLLWIGGWCVAWALVRINRFEMKD
jgi:hypothetical protein